MKPSFMFLCATAILLSTNAVAQQRSESEKAQIAAEFLTPKATRASSTSVQITPVEVTPELSIYTRTGGGWVIVSGDERTRGAILAYSNEGQFDLESATVREWVGGYREQIRSLANIRADGGTTEPGTTVVGPLITTKWDQGGPYYFNTPTYIEDFFGHNFTDHYFTGCVATALAQVMNYWQWPKRGQGKHTNIHYPSAAADFSLSEYDWDNMLDEYTTSTYEFVYDNDSNIVDITYYGNWTDVEADAVAKLMYDCGVALDVKYKIEGTGTSSFDIPKALCAYFDYSTDAKYLERNKYSGDWDALLRNELDADRPICYGGIDSTCGGHAFVCDGYDDQGYFHFNFGWGGECDGYYLTSAITPISGNTSYVFTSGQDIVYGIHPAGQDDKVIMSDGLYYRKLDDGLECLATENIGPDGHVIIPDKVNDMPVTSIAEGAFYDNPNFKSLVIGDNVKTIGQQAFYSCISLDTVTIGSSVQSIGYGAFLATAIRNVVIPSSAELIDIGAFQKCKSLQSVVIGDGVTTIGQQAFYLCSSLDTVTIGSSVQFIGSGAFSETAIRNVLIPSSVELIDTAAFQLCKSLQSVVIGDGVKNIASGSFYFCTSLDTVTIGSCVKTIGIQAFDSTAIRHLEIPSSVELIDKGAFQRCTSLQSVVIGDGVKIIAHNSFYNCTSLDTVTIGPSVKTIGRYAFYSAPIRHLEIPSSVELIDTAAFEYCTSLKSVVLGDGVKQLGYGAFYSCISLDTVTIGSSVQSIGYGAFSETAIRNVLIPSSVELIDSAAFQKCTSLQSVVIGDGVKTISDNAFYNCISLASVTFGSSVERIGDYAFAHVAISDLVLPPSLISMDQCSFGWCPNLKSITFPESLKAISDGAFTECPSLESVEIPNGIESIGDAAFDDCASLKSVVIGSGVKNIGSAAFAENPKLTSVTCLATTPPVCDDSRFGDVFVETNISKATLYVPKGSRKMYKIVNPWKGFGTINEVDPTGVEMPEFTKPDNEYYLNSRIKIVDGKKYLVR